MRHHLIPHECTANQSSQPHRPLSAARPLPHSQTQTTEMPGSRDGQSTVLSKAVAMVSLSAAPTVACSEQLAHSKTARTIWSQSRHIHLFPVNNPSLDTDQYSPPAKLQISATVTTLFTASHCYLLIRMYFLWSSKTSILFLYCH